MSGDPTDETRPEVWCNGCQAFHTCGVEVATCQSYVRIETTGKALRHGCRLPVIRWLGREWCCRCGAEWFCMLGAGKRIWARRRAA